MNIISGLKQHLHCLSHRHRKSKGVKAGHLVLIRITIFLRIIGIEMILRIIRISIVLRIIRIKRILRIFRITIILRIISIRMIRRIISRTCIWSPSTYLSACIPSSSSWPMGSSVYFSARTEDFGSKWVQKRLFRNNFAQIFSADEQSHVFSCHCWPSCGDRAHPTSRPWVLHQ